MSERKSWADIKARRADTPERRAGYEQARSAYEIGEKVRRLREDRGVTQTELAQRMGTTQSVIARLELGGASPRLDTLERVAAALDQSLTIDFQPFPANTAPGQVGRRSSQA